MGKGLAYKYNLIYPLSTMIQKYIFHYLLAFLIFWTQSTAFAMNTVRASTVKFQPSISDKLLSSTSLRDFLKKVKPRVNGKTYQFLEKKSKAVENPKIAIQKLSSTNGQDRYQLNVEGQQVVFSIHPDGTKATINNRPYTVDFSKDLQTLWDEVISLLPNSPSKTTLLWESLLPKAEAVELVTLLIVTSVIVVIALTLITGQASCLSYENYKLRCQQLPNKNSKIFDFVINAQSFLKTFKSRELCEIENNDLEECIEKVVRENPRVFTGKHPDPFEAPEPRSTQETNQ